MDSPSPKLVAQVFEGLPQVEERWAALSSGRMRYLYAPSMNAANEKKYAPPLLLIHGLLGYSFCWRFNIVPLASDFRIFAPDLLGAGYSDRPRHPACGLVSLAQQLLEFMNASNIDCADVIATSHGGAIAALLAERAPKRVRSMVLAAPVNPWSDHGRFLINTLSNPIGAFLFRGIAPLLKPSHHYFLARMYGDPRRIPPGTLDGYSPPLAVRGTIPYLLGVVAHWHEDMQHLERAYERLGERRVLLLWGDRDGAVLPQSAAELRRRIPGSELVMLPGVGHLPYEEVPEEFNRLVLEFLLRGNKNEPYKPQSKNHRN
ncbi:MAG: alpha/beta fold hydrolase [Candidatus Korobacteraceae bacterium]